MSKTKQTNGKALIRELKKRRQLCMMKLDKILSRLKIIDSFKNDPNVKKMDLKEYLHSKGYNFKDFFAPIGYYTTEEKVVSSDYETNGLSYSKGMRMNKELGFPIPLASIVSPSDKKELRESKYGMHYDSEIRTFIPKSKFDSETFSRADVEGDLGMDIMGGLSINDIGSLHLRNNDGSVFVNFFNDLLWEEHDNVEEELDIIEASLNKINDTDYSNADGKTESGKNAICRAGCATKHPFKKSKREGCFKDCDNKFKASQKQEERRENRDDRKEARKEFRADKKTCKEAFKSGETNRKEYNACLKRERQEKRSDIKEAGGNIFVRTGRTFAKVFPLTALSRGGVLVLVGVNAFGFSTRLAPALLPEAEAKKIFSPEAIELAKKGWAKVKKGWANLGGNPSNLQEKIIKGYKKKPYKIKAEDKVQSGFEGVEYEYSNVGGISIATAVTAGISALAGLINSLNKAGAKNNPYKDGEAPQEYLDSLKDGTVTDVPKQEPDKPQLDPTTGKWIDPKTGKVIDPTTGEFKDEIFGINKWLAISIGVVGIFGVYYLLKKKK